MANDEFANTQALHGRLYQAKSGLIFRFETMGLGGLRVISIGRQATEEEEKEVHNFISNELGADLYSTNKILDLSTNKLAKQEESDAFQKFLKNDPSIPLIKKTS